MAPFGRRDMTDGEISENFPGYEAMEDGGGHYFDSPDGRIMITGGLPNDQIYAQERLGNINVSRAWEALHNAGIKPHIVALDEGIKRNISKADISYEYVRRLASAKLKLPIVMVVASDGVQVVDGHHRLARHILDQRRNFLALLVPPTGLEIFQVRTWIDRGNGRWQLIAGASFEDVAAEIALAKKWTPQSLMRPNR